MGLSNFTSTEILNEINKLKKKHELIKTNIIELTNQIENIEIEINEKIKILTELEENYIILVEELNNRK